jgi:hypothetical protein
LRDVFDRDGLVCEVRIAMPDEDAWRRILALLWAIDPEVSLHVDGQPRRLPLDPRRLFASEAYRRADWLVAGVGYRGYFWTPEELEFDFFPDGTDAQRTAVLDFVQRLVDLVGCPAHLRSESDQPDDGELVIEPGGGEVGG